MTKIIKDTIVFYDFYSQSESMKTIKINTEPFICDHMQNSPTMLPYLSANEKMNGLLYYLSVSEKNKQEKHGDTILANTPTALMLLNSKYDIIAFNKQLASVMRKFVKVNIQKGMNLVNILPNFRKDDVKKKLDLVSKGSIIEYEAAYHENFWLSVSFYPVINKKGAINEISVTLRDITHYKSIEGKLRKRHQQNKSLLDSLAEGVIYQSLDKKNITCNKSALSILGITKAQLQATGFPLQEWKLLSDTKEEIDFNDLISKDDTFSQSIWDRTIGIQRSNKIQWLSLNIESIKDKNGNKHACVISFSDITRQKKTNRELQLLLLAARKVNNSVVITDSQKRVIWANKAFTKNTGYEFEDVKGKVPGRILQGPDTNPETVALMKESLHKELPFECEVENYKKTGEKFWMRIQVQPLYDNTGIISGYLGVGADITEQKKLQEKLIHQKVEEQKKIILATIAGQEKERNEIGRELHDNINQILAATKMQLEFHMRSENSKSEYLKNGLDFVNLAIREIRNLSKHLVAPRFHENSLLDEISLMTANFRLNGKLKLNTSGFEEKEISEDIKLTIFRIIQEQLNNTVKYAKANSVTVQLKGNENSIDLVIKDDGVGFDTTKKRNGIGLSNIQNRVELYYGSMKIESAPGKGCEMKVTIPLKKEMNNIL